MERISQLRAWKHQAEQAGLDINDEDCNVVLRLLNHALEAHDKIAELESEVKKFIPQLYIHRELDHEGYRTGYYKLASDTEPVYLNYEEELLYRKG